MSKWTPRTLTTTCPLTFSSAKLASVTVFASTLWLLPPSVIAQPDTPLPAGVQALPPGPAPIQSKPLLANPKQRRAIRGCRIEIPCAQDLMAGLREFERASFTSGPWTEPRRPHLRFRRGQKPTSIRPDLPWLAKLKLPDIPVHWDERMIRYLEFYKNDPRGRRIMSAWLRNQGRYRKLIEAELRQAQLPRALLYIAMIESSYYTTEHSRSGASGLWQFMPASGRIYSLTISRWLDERNDPVRSTRAAMLYFQDLYQRFGNWDLALTAYNAGYGTILRTMAKYNSNHLWTLLDYENALPWESSIYVPKFLAAAIVGENRKLFGFANLQPAAPFAFHNVEVRSSVRLSTLAKAAGVDTATLAQLNPQLRRKRTPPGLPRYVLRIPPGSARRFATKIHQLRSDWDGYSAYTIAHGERFEDIATTHAISRYELRKLNELASESEAHGGMVLVVPTLSKEQKQANRARAEDSLYAASVPQGAPGEKLLMAVPEPTLKVRGKKRLFYRVVAGDSLTRVARVFGINRYELAAWNSLVPQAHLYAQMVLQVWVPHGFRTQERNIAVLDPSRLEIVKSGSPAHLDRAEARTGRKRVIYRAQGKESFTDIGQKIGLSHRDLARINRMSPFTVLEAGQEIVIYQVVDQDASPRAAKQAKIARKYRAKHRRKTRARQRKRGPSKHTTARSQRKLHKPSAASRQRHPHTPPKALLPR